MSKFFKALQQANRDQTLPAGAGPKAPGSGEAPSPGLADREPAPLPGPQDTDPVRDTEPAPAPLWTADLADGVDEHLVSLVTPGAFEAEQYRALRHIIGQLHDASTLKLIAVSSPAIGDGKTVTAINLAGALAQAPAARVLLVDADVRRPSIGSALGLDDPRAPDLVSAIMNTGLTLDRLTRLRPPFNLSVVCGGQVPLSPYEVLKSPRLGHLMDEARRRYDYVVLDAPPLVGVPDCRAIAGCVDGFLVVVAADRTPRKQLEEALNTIDTAKILGLVFNADERPVAQYYHSGYGASSNGHPRQRWGRAAVRARGWLRRDRDAADPVR
jgi:capsular exopolysaccharide synthesis family protein